MELTGRLLQKLAVQSGTSARGQWAKQEFVIEYQDGNFPTKACFSVWGQDKAQDLERFQINDEIKVEFNVSSREYNGKWYTDLRAWRISPAQQSTPAYQQPYQAPAQAAAPVKPAYTPDVPAGFAPSAPAADDPSDDLPF